MATERKYKKNLELYRGNMTPDEVRQAKNSRTKARNEIWREVRQREAIVRNSAWNLMTPAEKLKSLDRRLGIEVGAKKQRTKLYKELTNGNAGN